MVNTDSVAFNIAAFIGGLFVLEFGADKFIDHTAKIASRTGVPPTLIALLTAGAEWEELVVVIAAISQKQSPLALGNILGSSISNILGAFSLGLIFSPSAITFDRSAKIYTGVLLGLTTFFSIFILFFESLGRIGGFLLLVTFVLYFISIAWAIYKGIVSPPVDSDSDSDSDSSSSSDSDSDSDSDKDSIPLKEKPVHKNTHLQVRRNSSSSNTSTLRDLESGQHTGVPPSPANAPAQHNQHGHHELHKDIFDGVDLSPIQTIKSGGHSNTYHITHLIFGFLALSLSGYILSHSVTTLSAEFSLSSTLLGITLLSFATTLPEKVVSIFSAKRGETGIVVANTAGSNIFLVTLCAGVLYLTGDMASLKGSVTLFEIGTMWMSSIVLFVIVLFGGRRWMGWALFAAYIAFIVCEFTLDRDIDG